MAVRALPLAGILVLATFGSARVAAQCPAPISYPFVGAVPANDATGVARDGAVLLAYGADLPADTWACSAITATDVHVVEADSGTRVTGILVPWGDNCARVPAIAWRSVDPLAANQKYDVEVAWQEPDAASAQTWSSSFTTGDTTLPPLTANDNIVATLGEVREVIVRYGCVSYTACGLPGAGCDFYEETQLTVTVSGLDSIQGGQSGSGYEVVGTLTRDTPATYSGPGFSDSDQTTPPFVDERLDHLDSGSLGAVTFQIPWHSELLTYCVAVNIWDAAGNTLQPPPTCFDPAQLEAHFAGDAGAGGAGGQSHTPGLGGTGGRTGGTGGDAGSGGVPAVDSGAGGSAADATGGSGGAAGSAAQIPNGGVSQGGPSDSGASASPDGRSGDAGGCGCKAALRGHHTGSWAVWGALLLCLLGLRWGRRRRECSGNRVAPLACGGSPPARPS